MPASWSYETSVEYHVASSSLFPPPPSPCSPKKKRTSEIDIPTVNTLPLRPPRVLHPSPTPSPSSPSSLPFALSPGRDPRIVSSSTNPAKIRAARASTGSASIDHSLKRTSQPSVTLNPQDSRSFGKLAGWRAPASVSGPERGLPTRWSKGKLSITLHGEGGRGGGELRVLRLATRKVAFSVGLPTLNESGVWAISDIQHLHSSVSARSHGLSLRLTSCRVVQEPAPPSSMPADLSRSRTRQESTTSSSSTTSTQPMSPPKSFMSAPGFLSRKSRQPSESRFLGMIPLPSLSTRSRSKTISASDIPQSTTPPSSDRPPPPRLGSQHFQAQETGEQEVILFLSFSNQRDKDEWYALLRSLAKVPVDDGGRKARPHRRLKICVLDIQETQSHSMAMPDLDSSSQQDGSITSEGRPPGRSPGKRSKADTLEIKRINAKPGWSWKDQIRVELLLDERLVARTGWTKAADGGATPFWGEQFHLSEVPHFSTCTLLLLRQKDKVSVLFGKVDLPLVSSFSKVDDERYPVRSIHGTIIGEIRLTVSYQEVDVIPLVEYNSLLAHSTNTSKFLYVMGGRGQMEGTMEYLCRIALCEGALMDRVRDKATIEARSAGTTLFRSTTPLSKTLEVLMRMMCADFLEASLGPTIRRVINERIEPRLFHTNYSGDEPALNFRVLGVMTELIQTCWANMYDNRHLFPNFIRHILAHLFRMVKEFHDDGDDLLRYKAVSSFVFLRLIGPALMSPHLFGLADSLLDPPQQRTLTLIAKVLHTLAFFSDKDLVRHSDLALFKVFIQTNGDVMIDYLVSLATPTGDYQAGSCVSEEVEQVLTQRRNLMPDFQAEAMPHLTAAGPIDLSADWAVCCETWYEKRHNPGVKLSTVTSVSNVTDDIADLLAKYDDFLDHIHDLACPPPDPLLTCDTAGRSEPSTDESTGYLEWGSRPSLNLSISTTPSSEESHKVVTAMRQSLPAEPVSKKSFHKPNLSINTTVCVVRRPDIEATNAESPDREESPTTARQPRPHIPYLPPRPRTPASPVVRRFDPPSLALPHPPLSSLPTSALPVLPTSPLSPSPRKPEKSDTQRSTRRRRPTLPSFKLLTSRSNDPPPPVPPMLWQPGLGASLTSALPDFHRA